jgi:very-short-patch-repair endonuclease
MAAGQAGVVHRSQVRAAGFSRKCVRARLRDGRWIELYPGVFRVGGATPSVHQRLVAAALWAGDGTIRAPTFTLSHRCAAASWRFGRFPEGPVELMSERDLRPPPPTIVHVVERLDPNDVTCRDGLPVTTAARTLFDLSSVCRTADVRASLDEALRRRWTTLELLEAMARRVVHHPGVIVFRSLVEAVAGGEPVTESELESLVLDLIDAEGLPRPTKQQRLKCAGRGVRLDFVYPAQKVVIEADGRAWHTGAAQFERDKARDNALAIDGYLVLHWTWAAVRDRPRELAAQLRTALAARSAA